jgi:hypothetical protein
VAIALLPVLPSVALVLVAPLVIYLIGRLSVMILARLTKSPTKKAQP